MTDRADPHRRNPALEQAIDDHRQLLAIQASLAGRFADGSCPAFNAWITQVRAEIAALAGLLESHFLREQSDRLHDEIASALPNASFRLSQLLAEHGKLLDRALRLSDLAGSTVAPGTDAALRAEASELFAMLDEHERAERELFLHALEGEGGPPD